MFSRTLYRIVVLPSRDSLTPQMSGFVSGGRERLGRMGSELAQPIRVAAVDDHPLILVGIEHFLSRPHNNGRPVEFVATVASVHDLLDPAASYLPIDVVLLDIRLGDASRPRDNVTALRRAGCHVLVFTDGARTAWMADALAAGALGVVLKDQPADHLAEAISTVAEGETFLSPELARVLEDSPMLRPALSQREIDVLRGVASGLLTKQVARSLGLQESTVKEYIKRIRHKYDALGRSAATRVDLSKRAAEDGYLDRPGGG